MSPVLPLRMCGSGAVLGGVLFVAWGYLHRSGIREPTQHVVDVLALLVPVLFAGALAGVWMLYEGRLDRLGTLGLLLALVGLLWGTTEGVLNLISADDVADSISGWLYKSLRSGYGQPLSTGLLLLGISTRSSGTPRYVGFLTLAMGISGWAYLFTETNAPITEVFEKRTAHVFFGLLFAAGWVALGIVLRGVDNGPKNPRRELR